MPATHTLPVPPGLLERACDGVNRAVCRLPFEQDGIQVTSDLIAAAIEELNAESTRTLAIRHRTDDDGMIVADGLDRHLALRGFTGSKTAEIIARVLGSARIVQQASITDRRSHRFLRGIRLLPVWTWTITSSLSDPSGYPGIPDPENVTGSPWTSVCPVCRAGTLGTISGQRLFGICETDYLVCTSCGAKYIPEGAKFRLVAIKRKQDFLWTDLLNRAFTTGEWQLIAKGGWIPAGRHNGSFHPQKNDRGLLHDTYDRTGNGRLVIETKEQTLFFTAFPLEFRKGKEQDLFLRRREPVRSILHMPAFRHLTGTTESSYSPYLDHPVGPFLSDLRMRRDPFYKNFLHPFGEYNFCLFRAGDSVFSHRSGVYIIAREGLIQAAGASLLPFRETVNEVLGVIRPGDCYLDGKPDNCRINSLLCATRNKGGLYIHPVDDEKETHRIAEELTGQSA